MADFSSRLKASGIHLGLSALIGLLAATLVLGLWYPWPYRVMSGGQSLFMIIVSVDLVLGPALTFVAFNRDKARTVLVRDLAVITVLQACALAYGLHVVFTARPVALVFEDRRFRVVAAIDVLEAELPKALPGLQRLSFTGPVLLGTRKPKDARENTESIDYAFKGFDIGSRPSFWQPYAASADTVLAAARPLSQLYQRYPGSQRAIDQELLRQRNAPGGDLANLKFLPVISKEGNWCAVLDARSGALVGFIPYDGFF